MQVRVKYESGMVVMLDIKSEAHLQSIIARGAEKYEDGSEWKPISSLKFVRDVPPPVPTKEPDFLTSQEAIARKPPEKSSAESHAADSRPAPEAHVQEPEEPLFTPKSPEDKALAAEVHDALHSDDTQKVIPVKMEIGKDDTQKVIPVKVEIGKDDSPDEIVRKVKAAEAEAEKASGVPVAVPVPAKA